MSTFSTTSCYAALSSCAKSDVLKAYSRMLIALVQHKRYAECDAEEMCRDFKAYYGFALPYHPMKAIIDECIKSGHFIYNSSTYQYFPDYDAISQEDFLDIVKKKDLEYETLLQDFGGFLIKTHNMHCSKEDLDEKIHAFVERYGVKTQSDKNILFRVKDDYLLAEYLIYCEENNRQDVLNYINEYIVGLSLSEIFTYSERPEAYTAKKAHVYLDTSILFRLFGIDSSDHADSYKEFVKSMQRLGMQIMVYDHTVNEMIGIIEGSKRWIGNPEYDANLCSEATYFFVTHNWTVKQVDEFSGSLRIRLKSDFNITVDSMSYPPVADIHTIYEADIKEMIIQAYQDSRSTFDLDKLNHTIDQDAKSIFFTQHKNGDVVPYHINDVKNIFITTNRTLGKIGYNISKLYAVSKEYFIPLVMTDITWGTLIWLDSPATISAINRPRLVSAAYAAFRPSSELVKKLNDTLHKLEEDGKITPEQCYFLKVSPVAQQLLAKETINDPERLIDLTPLEILRSLENDAYQLGSLSRQREVDELSEEVDELHERVKESHSQLLIERQRNAVANCEKTYEILQNRVVHLQDKRTSLEGTIKNQTQIKENIDDIVTSRIKWVKIAMTVIAIIFALSAIYVGYNWSWIIGVIPFVLAIYTFVATLWNDDSASLLSLVRQVEKRIREEQNDLRCFSPEKFAKYEQEFSQLLLDLNCAEKELAQATENLNHERNKLVQFSVDCLQYVQTSND